MPKSLKMLELKEILIVHARLKKVRNNNKYSWRRCWNGKGTTILWLKGT